MQVQISLLRHAKASYHFGLLGDKSRPLTEQGITDAQKLAFKLLGRSIVFSEIWVSTATRCLQTLEILNEIVKINKDIIKPFDTLYDSNLKTLIQLVQKNASNKQHLLIIGHNPTLHEALNYWCFPKEIDFLPPCGFVTLNTSCNNLDQLDEGKASIEWLDFPSIDYNII